MGWEERTEDSIYVLFLPKKKKNYTINDSHLRPHSVFPQDTPYMRELHWNQVWGRKKERAPFCNQGQPVQTPAQQFPPPSQASLLPSHLFSHPQMGKWSTQLWSEPSRGWVSLIAGPFASFSCHKANTFFLPDIATAWLYPSVFQHQPQGSIWDPRAQREEKLSNFRGRGFLGDPLSSLIILDLIFQLPILPTNPPSP